MPTLNLSKATFQRAIACFWIFLSRNLSAYFPSSLPGLIINIQKCMAFFTELTRVASTYQMHLPWFSNQHAGSRPAPDVAKRRPSSSNPSIYLQFWDPNGWHTRCRRQPSRRPVLISSSIEQKSELRKIVDNVYLPDAITVVVATSPRHLS